MDWFRALVDEDPECWEAKIPYCQAILRIIPLKALGGRSPCDVVTGVRPKLPAGLDPAMPVEHLELDGYMERLRVYFTQTYKAVFETQKNDEDAA